ncbi:MAG: hypothetical protein BBJ57_09050 [Desulfobacterales bacterium PC51MH44]|nr:MAG: hypothetical protein BBJ57_09050 [Desulfobacterales bacterium PC51MH44]
MATKKKRQTQLEKVEGMIKEAVEKGSAIEITGCSFVGVKEDKTRSEAITAIALALKENAASLGELAKAVSLKGVTFGPMIHVDGR